MERKEIELLNLIQEDFPLVERPYQTIGIKLNLSENEVIELIRKLKKDGYIRRLGGSFDSKKLGYCSTLCAMEVPENRIEEVAKIVNGYPGITHNYLRSHKYNMWFTLTAESKESLDKIVEEIKEKTKIKKLIKLTSMKTYKIKVNFSLS